MIHLVLRGESISAESRQSKIVVVGSRGPQGRIGVFGPSNGAQSVGAWFPSQRLAENRNMATEHKYARIEWERRFLLDRFPAEAAVNRVRRITDRYIEGTTLRLRQQEDNEGRVVFKLTQKLADKSVGARQGLITSMYLTQDEFDLLARLPARVLTKTRHSVPPFGIDVFDGVLTGLVLAEAEFNSAAEADALALPSFIVHEVSDDIRFTGGHLVNVSRRQLKDYLAEHGINSV